MELTNQNQWYMLGQAYLGNSYGDLYIRIYARWVSQDETNLTSLVQYQARTYYNGYDYIYDGGGNGTLSGTSATTSSFNAGFQIPVGETPLATIEATVSHDENTGAASVSASAYLSYPNFQWSATASGSANLPTIDISTLRIGVNGSWKKAKPYLRVNGAWKQCKAYIGVNNSWKKGV